MLSSMGTPRALGVRHDLGEIRVEHGLAHLVELDRVERPEPGALGRDLVEEAEDLLLLHEAPAAVHDLVRAPGALEVAGVGDLDEQVVDRVEAARQLLQLREREPPRGRPRGPAGGSRRTREPRDEELLPELEAERRRRGSACAPGRSPAGERRRVGSAAGRPPSGSSAARPACRDPPGALARSVEAYCRRNSPWPAPKYSTSTQSPAPARRRKPSGRDEVEVVGRDSSGRRQERP